MRWKVDDGSCLVYAAGDFHHSDTVCAATTHGVAVQIVRDHNASDALTDAYTRLGEYLIDWPVYAGATLRNIHREMGKALGIGKP